MQRPFFQPRRAGNATRAGVVLGVIAVGALGISLAARGGGARVTVVPAESQPGAMQPSLPLASESLPLQADAPGGRASSPAPRIEAPAPVSPESAFIESAVALPASTVPAIAPANAAELERRETQTPAVVIQVMPVLRAAGIGLGPPVPIDEPLLQPSQSESAREATPNTTKPAAATPPAAKPTQAAPTPPQATRPQATPPTANTSTLIDLNAATKSQLELLPGIGPALAQRVLDHRAKLGGFTKVEDLDGVRGIGPKVLAKLRPLVRVGPKPVLQSEGARDASQPTTQPSGPPR